MLQRPSATASERAQALQDAIVSLGEIEAEARARIARAQEAEAQSVILRGPGKSPLVNGQEVPPLNDTQYKVISALKDAGAAGLTKLELRRNSGCGGAVDILKRLAGHEPWTSVIGLAGKTGGGYRIL